MRAISSQSKTHHNLSVHFERDALQKKRFVLPLLDCSHGCGREKRMSQHQFNGRDITCLSDHDMQDDLSLDSPPLRVKGIVGIDSLYQ